MRNFGLAPSEYNWYLRLRSFALIIADWLALKRRGARAPAEVTAIQDDINKMEARINDDLHHFRRLEADVPFEKGYILPIPRGRQPGSGRGLIRYTYMEALRANQNLQKPGH